MEEREFSAEDWLNYVETVRKIRCSRIAGQQYLLNLLDTCCMLLYPSRSLYKTAC